MTQRITVLGASGMLGAMLVDVFADAHDIELTATVRSESHLAWGRSLYPQVNWRLFDVGNTAAAFGLCGSADWLINAIGITKPLIHDDNSPEVARAIHVNSLFPLIMARMGTRVLQIATDCVYSGLRGRYLECDSHDATDAYGKTKSLGEAHGPTMHHLRCSIIGPEPHQPKFLLDWLLRQPRGATVKGFTNHDWNGVTTLHFARVCLGIIRSQLDLPHLSHLIPADAVTKCELLRLMAEHFGRDDLAIEPTEAPSLVDRTLATQDPEFNRILWSASGYTEPPTLDQMLHELAAYQPRFAATNHRTCQAAS